LNTGEKISQGQIAVSASTNAFYGSNTIMASHQFLVCLVYFHKNSTSTCKNGALLS